MKLKTLFTLLIFQAFIIHGISQDVKFIFGVESSFGISDRQVISDGTLGESYENLFRNYEHNAFGAEFGINLELRKNDKFGWQVGINYLNYGVQSRKNDLFFFEPDPGSATAIKYKTRYSYLEVPLKFNYYFIRQPGHRFYISTGLGPNINLENKRSIFLYFADDTVDEVVRDEQGDFVQLNVMAELGIGLELDLGGKLMLNILPRFRIQARKLVEPVALNRRLFYYGIGIGLKMK